MFENKYNILNSTYSQPKKKKEISQKKSSIVRLKERLKCLMKKRENRKDMKLKFFNSPHFFVLDRIQSTESDQFEKKSKVKMLKSLKLAKC